MKCPHCGSTAQVRSTGAPVLSDNELVLTENFTCGCGAYFSTDYERNSEGAWEMNWIQLHFVDKTVMKKFKKLGKNP
jgi:hypothetical protein